ncbi:MAG: hypothetical protein V7637_685 [Mycobacteriales bacterium]
MHPHDESERPDSTTLTEDRADAGYRDAGHREPDDAQPAGPDGELPAGQRPEGWYPDAEPVLPVDETAAATPPASWAAEDGAPEPAAAEDVDAPEPIAGGSDRSESTVDGPMRQSTMDGDATGVTVGGWNADSERGADEAQAAEPVAGEPGVVVVEPAGTTDLGAVGPAGTAGTPAEEDEAALTAPYGSELAGAEVAGIEPPEDGPDDGTPGDAEPALPAAEAVPGGLGAEQPVGAPADASALRSRWRDVQAGFVDDPAAAVSQAADLVQEAVRALTSQLADLRGSVGEWSGDEPPTERMRVTVRRYREVFERLLRD